MIDMYPDFANPALQLGHVRHRRVGERHDQTSSFTTGITQGLTLDGGEGDDSITGSSRTNGASEVLLGGDGNDTLRASSGDDFVDGGADNDSIFGDAGNDTLDGGTGDDTISGGTGDDTIDGGTEATDDGDIAVYSGNRGTYSIIGSSTGFTVSDNSSANGDDGTDFVQNVERLRFLDGDIIVGTGLVGASIVGTEFDDNGGVGNPGPLIGTILNDTIQGLGGDDRIEGLAGIDIIDAGSGDDTVLAGDQNDTVTAGDGDDSVTGGAGDDSIDMGDGFDIAVFAGAQGDYDIAGDSLSVTVTDTAPGVDGDDGTDVITGARILEFSDGVVYLNGLPQPDAYATSTDEDVAIDIPLADLLAGDTDPDGDPLSITGVENAVGGTASIVGDVVRFIPTPEFQRRREL